MKTWLLLIALLWPALALATRDALLLPAEVTKKFSTNNGPFVVRFDTKVSKAGIEVRFRVEYAGATWAPDAELDSEVTFEPDQATRVFADPSGERFWMRVPVGVRGEAALLAVEFLGREIVGSRIETENGGTMKPELRGQMKKQPNQQSERNAGATPVSPSTPAAGVAHP